MSLALHTRYIESVEEIERRFAVANWRSGDVDIWPLARLELYLAMYQQQDGCTPEPGPSFVRRTVGLLARPLANRWSARGFPGSLVARASPADAVFLGDGVSLDCVEGRYQDRYGEPLMAALERGGAAVFAIQGGDLSRLPWQRPSFPANLVERRGRLRSLGLDVNADLPDHEAVLDFLVQRGASAAALRRRALLRRARLVSATATAFERLLGVVRPSFAFVTGYFAGAGPAFVLACRRRQVLAVDLQRSPHQGSPMAYEWSRVPNGGYSTMPNVFWCWTRDDAVRLAAMLPEWPRAIHGGHTQYSAPIVMDGQSGAMHEREILVALQPIGGHRADWDRLAAEIEKAPPSWRWWIRRHPASRAHQDSEFGRLLALRRPNVICGAASQVPLPALLGRMSVVISLASGVAVEAAMTGVPALFLSGEANGPFSALIREGTARVVQLCDVVCEVARLDPPQRIRPSQPDTDAMLRYVAHLASAHRGSFRESEPAG